VRVNRRLFAPPDPWLTGRAARGLEPKEFFALQRKLVAYYKRLTPLLHQLLQHGLDDLRRDTSAEGTFANAG